MITNGFLKSLKLTVVRHAANTDFRVSGEVLEKGDTFGSPKCCQKRQIFDIPAAIDPDQKVIVRVQK